MKKILFFVSLWLLLFSCSRTDSSGILSSGADKHFISVSKMKTILGGKNFRRAYNKSSKTGRIVNKEVGTIQSVSKSKEIVYYIVNYVDGGFVIISADDRVSPVLAVSETNTLDYNNAKNQNGISFWLDAQADAIEYIRTNDLPQSKDTQNLWDGLLGMAPPDNGPHETTTYSGQLIATTWGQDFGYNDAIPLMSCGRPLTGCVATAMAQIIKFNGYSSINNYNFSQMPNFSGSIETARLMYDVGIAVNMSYGCYASGASGSSIAPGFAKFGYNNVLVKSVNTAGFQDATLDGQLTQKWPVVFTGSNGGGGHAWVCDGSYFYEYWDGTSGWSTQLYHMNWGWNGSYNGYFSLNNLNPGGFGTYSNVTMYYNIHHF